MTSTAETPLRTKGQSDTSDFATTNEAGKAEDGELFPGREYDRPVPTLDGHRADTLKLAFAGAVEIDLMDEQALAWFKGLRFGQELELTVTAVVGKSGWTLKTNSEGDETVVHTLGLAVHSYTLDQ